jgi:site-specific DNA-cytosine methylase
LRRHSTKLLKEETAKPYRTLLKVLAECLPSVGVLENVAGLKVVMDKVLADLRHLKSYLVMVVPMDAADLGDSVHRTRYYSILVRRDVAVDDDVAELADVAKQMCCAARLDVADHVSNRMLPASNRTVMKCLADKRARHVANSKAAARACVRELKWQAQRKKYRQLVGPPASSSGTPAADEMCLAGTRVRDAWQMLLDGNPMGDIIADLLQSLSRMLVTRTGVSPTITPHSVICVRAARRCITHAEKLMLHGFPLHETKIPTTVSDTFLEDVGGNTMHLPSVGLALLIGIGLVNWTAGGSAGVPIAGSPSKPRWVFEDFGFGAKRKRAAMSIRILIQPKKQNKQNAHTAVRSTKTHGKQANKKRCKKKTIATEKDDKKK